MAAIASSGEMRYCCSLSGLRVMTIVRWAPPNGGGAETPSSVANSGRTRFSAMSCRSPCVRDGLLKISRSEEHTSELQSLAYLVCRLLLEKKKQKLQRRDV